MFPPRFTSAARQSWSWHWTSDPHRGKSTLPHDWLRRCFGFRPASSRDPPIVCIIVCHKYLNISYCLPYFCVFVLIGKGLWATTALFPTVWLMTKKYTAEHGYYYGTKSLLSTEFTGIYSMEGAECIPQSLYRPIGTKRICTDVYLLFLLFMWKYFFFR